MNLEQGKFDVIQAQIAHDVDVMAIYYQKLEGVQTNRYWQDLRWKQEQYRLCESAARTFLKGCAKLVTSTGSTDDLIKQYVEAKQQFEKKASLQGEKSGLVTVNFMNFTAPCSMRNEFQQCLFGLHGYLMVENQQRNLGLTMLPNFAYKRGQLWLLESSCLKSPSQCHVNLDRMFIVPFKEKPDARESRPMNYHGRLSLPLEMNDTTYPWRSVQAVSWGRSDVAEMIHARDMVVVDDVSPGALPDSSTAVAEHSSENGLRGAKSLPNSGVMLTPRS